MQSERRGLGRGIMICFLAKLSFEEEQGEEHYLLLFFYLSIYLTAPWEERQKEREGRNKKRSRRNGMKVGGVVARHESPSGRDAARAPKCPQGRTADSCRTQKGHIGVRLTATYTTRVTRLVRDARAALCYMYKVFRNYREHTCVSNQAEKRNGDRVSASCM